MTPLELLLAPLFPESPLSRLEIESGSGVLERLPSDRLKLLLEAEPPDVLLPRETLLPSLDLDSLLADLDPDPDHDSLPPDRDLRGAASRKLLSDLETLLPDLMALLADSDLECGPVPDLLMEPLPLDRILEVLSSEPDLDTLRLDFALAMFCPDFAPALEPDRLSLDPDVRSFLLDLDCDGVESLRRGLEYRAASRLPPAVLAVPFCDDLDPVDLSKDLLRRDLEP